MLFKYKQIYIVIILVILNFSEAYAHQPILNLEGEQTKNKPYVIDEPEISKAIYSNLNGSPEYYKITSDQPFNFYVGITVPNIDQCDTFQKYSFSILDEEFNIIKDFDGNAVEWGSWYEEYGKKWYWIGPEFGEKFKSTSKFKPGTYYIKVYSEDNKGNYVLAVGDEEKFTPGVILKMLFSVPKINKKFWDDVNCI
jgi:hypothetical protein